MSAFDIHYQLTEIKNLCTDATTAFLRGDGPGLEWRIAAIDEHLRRIKSKMGMRE